MDDKICVCGKVLSEHNDWHVFIDPDDKITRRGVLDWARINELYVRKVYGSISVQVGDESLFVDVFDDGSAELNFPNEFGVHLRGVRTMRNLIDLWELVSGGGTE